MTGRLVPLSPRRLSGDEPTAGGLARISDFWRWAFSDVRDNTTRGVFAEWLVGMALGCADGVREPWANHDLTTAGGIRVEVKSAAYLQAWETRRLSKLEFAGLAARRWDPETRYSPTAEYRADVYVFCVLTCVDHSILDPLDVAQWEFWVAPRSVIAATEQLSMGFARVKALARGPLSFDGLAAAVSDAYDAVDLAEPPSG